MITIIAATNRTGSNTLKIAKEALSIFKKTTDKEIKLLDLSEVDFEKLNTPSYQSNLIMQTI